MIRRISLLGLIGMACGAVAAPATYKVDPGHTFPAFEADHMGGLSIWRGKFKTTSGSVVLDRVARTGTVEISVDAGSIDFGMPALDKHMSGPDGLDVARYPTATYTGSISEWKGDVPAAVNGQLTLHGVTRPLVLTINSFMCKPNPMSGKETCGADASATFDRDAFGISIGKDLGFRMDVKLLISIEAVKAD